MNWSEPPAFKSAQVRASFDRAAAAYAGAAKLQRQVGEELLQRLDWLKFSPRRVIDLGCGVGGLSRALARRYPKAEIFALDLAPAMLREARRQAPRWFSRQHFVCADAAHLPLAPASADLVVSNLMLQWCPDYLGVFQELARLLRPDAYLLFSSLGPDTLRELRASWGAADAYTHVNPFVDMHHLGDALLAAGLADPVLDTERVKLHYPDPQALMRNLKAIGAHNLNRDRPHGLTGKTRLQAMLGAYETYREPAGIPATYEVVYGHAVGRAPVPPGAHPLRFVRR